MRRASSRRASALLLAPSRAPVLLLALHTLLPAHAFECHDEKRALVRIPDDFVNDDFCDCADGTDETSTGACEKAPFTCPQRPHRSKTIFASRVNDGICDCCDGSDEWYKPSLCPNTCVKEASKDLDSLEAACETKAQREIDGMRAQQDRDERLQAAEKTLAASAPALQRATAEKATAELAEAERLAERERRLAAGEVGDSLKLGEMSDEMMRVALARLALAKQVSGVDLLHDVLSAVESLAGEMEDVDSADMIEVAMEAKEAEEEAGEAYVDAPACAKGACGHEAELLALLPLGKLSSAEIRPILESFTNQTEQMGRLSKTATDLLRSAGVELDEAAVKTALELLEPFHDEAAEAARAAYAAIQQSNSAANAVMDELGPVRALTKDFGPAQEWQPLHARCFETADAEHGTFAYKFCPFDRFTQDGRTLGTYEGWKELSSEELETARKAGREPHGRYMVYGHGEDCDFGSAGIVPRSAKIFFECGEEEELRDVSEPHTCMYEGWVTSPSACSTGRLRAKHQALAEAAREAGLPYVPSDGLRRLLSL